MRLMAVGDTTHAGRGAGQSGREHLKHGAWDGDKRRQTALMGHAVSRVTCTAYVNEHLALRHSFHGLRLVPPTFLPSFFASIATIATIASVAVPKAAPHPSLVQEVEPLVLGTQKQPEQRRHLLWPAIGTFHFMAPSCSNLVLRSFRLLHPYPVCS